MRPVNTPPSQRVRCHLPGRKSARLPRTALSKDRCVCWRNLIWLYLILWLIEGGLRRWFLPGLASPLLLVRDPLVLAIYWIAASSSLFPFNGFFTWGLVLAALSMVSAMVVDMDTCWSHSTERVVISPCAAHLCHGPRVAERGHDHLGKIALLIAVPYTLLMVAQFYQPQNAWVNRGLGGNMEGAGFDGRWIAFAPPARLVSSRVLLCCIRSLPPFGSRCC